MLCLEEFSINEDFKGIRLNVKMVVNKIYKNLNLS